MSLGASSGGAIGPPESDPATDEPVPEPWFSRVRSDPKARRSGGRGAGRRPLGALTSPGGNVFTTPTPPSLIKRTCQTA